MPLRYGLIEPVDLGLPRLPRTLEGLRIGHVSDPHPRRRHRPQPRKRLHDLIDQLAAHRLDLLVLTGDYGTFPDDAEAGLGFLRLLVDRVKPALGTFGVFGNHDHPPLVEACLDPSKPAVPEITWLVNDAVRIEHKNTPIDLLGVHATNTRLPDATQLALNYAAFYDELGETQPAPDDSDRPFRLLLSHFPRVLPAASDLGVDLLLTGHTHGGQIRLPWAQPLENSSPLPLRLTTGLQRHGNTAALVSRGLGEMTIPMRVFCQPHAPLVTLRRQALMGNTTDRSVRLWHW